MRKAAYIMEKIKFNVTKEERKALVNVISGFIGWAPVYKGAPGFEYVLGNYIIDRHGTLIYDERVSEEDAQRLLAELSEQGFVWERDNEPDESAVPVDSEHTGDAPAKKTIIVDMPLFSDTALDNLRKLINGKSALIKKSIGADDLTVAVIGGAVHFNWFDPDSTEPELEAYKQFVSALCLFAKNQKRVTMKESAVDSEKFAFRCFLLRLDFIGAEYASARKVLLAKLSGNSSFKTGDHKSRGASKGSATADNGEENTEAVITREDSNDGNNAATEGI